MQPGCTLSCPTFANGFINTRKSIFIAMKELIFTGALGIVLLASCHNASESHGHAHAEAPASHGGANEIVLHPHQAQAAGVEVSTIQPGEFRQVIPTSGQVLAAQGDERMAVASVSGVVSFRGKVVEGMPISAGSALFTLSSNHMAEGDPVQKARVNYEVAKKEYERMQALVEDRIVSEKDFAQARQAYENARISYEAVSGGQSAQGQTVSSPIGGYIKTLLVKEGDYVQVGQPLASITRGEKLYLRADVSEKYYADLPNITSANFGTPYAGKVYSLDQLGGRLLSYGKSSGVESGYYVPVTFEFNAPQENAILPGTYVEIYLLGNTMEDVIALPHAALTEEQGSYFVYRQLDEECYEKQLVELGADDGQRVIIRSGVKPGDRIVTRGAYQVKLAGATSAIPAHTHEH